MVLDAAAHVGAAVLGNAEDAFDLGLDLLNNIVALTGDAHQAQVAQDIFRQEVMIERSMRIREDIRDAHKLMIENVQTQLLMGNLVLGICFAVLIEGRPSDPETAPQVMQELWASFAFWAVSMNFLSVWFALRFQEVVSVGARRRLLEKHRIFTPNDEVVEYMGGQSLAQKLSQLHVRGLVELSDLLGRYGPTTGGKPMLEALRERMTNFAGHPRDAEEDGEEQRVSHRTFTQRSGAARSVTLNLDLLQDEEEHNAEALGDTHDPHRPLLDVEVLLDSSVSKSEFIEVDCNRTARACRGMQPWSDSTEKIFNLPEFLIDETLLRCNWEMPCNLELRFRVRGSATLYVAAQWPPRTKYEAFRSTGPPLGWAQVELPRIGKKERFLVDQQFERVEGFSIFVSKDKMQLPLYRIVLRSPDRNGWRAVRLRFRFGRVAAGSPASLGNFEAPIVILRKGQVTTSEEDWPVTEFMQDLEEIQPLREYSVVYMSQGIFNLLSAAYCSHLSRVLTDRPWPECQREVVTVSFAFAPALWLAIFCKATMWRLFGADVTVPPKVQERLSKTPSPEGGVSALARQLQRSSSTSTFVDFRGRRTPSPQDGSPQSRASFRGCTACGGSWCHCPAPSCDFLNALAPGPLGHPRTFCGSPSCSRCSSGGATSHAGRPAGDGDATDDTGADAAQGRCADNCIAWCTPATRHGGGDAEEILVGGEGTPSVPLSRCITTSPRSAPRDLSEADASRFLPYTLTTGDSGRYTVDGPRTHAGGVGLFSGDDADTRDRSLTLTVVPEDSQDTSRPRDFRQHAGGVSSFLADDADTREQAHTVTGAITEAFPGAPEDDDASSDGEESAKDVDCCWCARCLSLVRCPSLRSICLALYSHLRHWLNFFFWVVELLWILSIGWIVVISAIRKVFSTDDSQAVEPGYAGATAGACLPGSQWSLRNFAWPSPFFSPTAATMASDGTFWVAADWLLGELAASSFEMQRSFRLPVAVKGLFHRQSGEELLIASDAELLAWNSSDAPESPASGTLATTLRWLAEADIPADALPVVARLPVAALGLAAVVAGAPLPSITGTLDAVAMAPSAGGVNLCAAAEMPETLAVLGGIQPLQLEVAVQLPLHLPVTAAVRGVYVCTEGDCGAGQPVLWVADSTGCLSALGLDTGQLLGQWRLLVASGTTTPECASGSGGTCGAASVALAGNATHLFAVVNCAEEGGAAVLSAFFSAILSDGAGARPC